jgi:hypothetical protein
VGDLTPPSLRLKTMHLERSFLPLLPPCRQAADISAARNLNNPGYIFICTYIIVIKVFLQEHFVKIAVMFLQEHSAGGPGF